MKTSEMFDGLLDNLKVGDTHNAIAARRDEITKALNADFRGISGSTDNRLMIGSYGRHTAIRSISDLDMIFILPPKHRSAYRNDTGPRRVLNRVRDVLKARYPRTDIRVDQCVVRVQFSNFKFEVQPAFENEDSSFDYPDTGARAWKVTKPRDEIEATRACNERTSGTMRHLARMTRAWKNTNGVPVGGLLIDTFVHNFFENTSDYDGAGTDTYDLLARDFFHYLSDEPDQNYYLALGSNQRVRVKGRFQPKAGRAYQRAIEAIELGNEAAANKKWREVFGPSVPLQKASETSLFYTDTEEFIESSYAIDISHTVAIDCQVTQAGWRPASLRDMLTRSAVLLPNKDLAFTVSECHVEAPYRIMWKVLNRGDEAERRNEVRGQIIEPNTADGGRNEHTKFRGEHIVECYVIKGGVVVARDVVDVPISSLVTK